MCGTATLNDFAKMAESRPSGENFGGAGNAITAPSEVPKTFYRKSQEYYTLGDIVVR